MIASIFAQARQGAGRACAPWSTRFNDVLPTARGAAALGASQERLTALAQRDESIPCRAALDAVQTYAGRGSADQIDPSLRRYADFVTREYQLAVRHAERRN